MSNNTYTLDQVIDHIEEKRKNNPPKMVFEADYKRLKKEMEKVTLRSEACLDALILDLNGVKEAMSFVEFENRQYRRRLSRMKKKVQELEARLAVGEK